MPIVYSYTGGWTEHYIDTKLFYGYGGGTIMIIIITFLQPIYIFGYR